MIYWRSTSNSRGDKIRFLLSPTSIADEMREEHRRRVLGE